MRQPDTANRLRKAPVTQVIAVSGGKGGVGKTTLAVNLGAALAQSGQRVLLLDGDLGLANIDVHLGLTPRYTLQHVLSGERTLAEVIQPVGERLHVVPAASGVARMARLSSAEHAAVVQAFATLPQSFDTLLVDTAAGIGEQVLQLAAAAAHVLIVLCDEPASLTDAYGLIKVLSRDCGVRRFQVLANRVAQGDSGEALFRRLQTVTDRYLDVQLQYAGEIPEDPLLIKAVRSQRAVVQAYPGSPAARALTRLAGRTRDWVQPVAGSGRIEFFFERLHAQRERRLQVVK
jgi:flagellar biosynthesis protein FlhG